MYTTVVSLQSAMPRMVCEWQVMDSPCKSKLTCILLQSCRRKQQQSWLALVAQFLFELKTISRPFFLASFLPFHLLLSGVLPCFFHFFLLYDALNGDKHVSRYILVLLLLYANTLIYWWKWAGLPTVWRTLRGRGTHTSAWSWIWECCLNAFFLNMCEWKIV